MRQRFQVFRFIFRAMSIQNNMRVSLLLLVLLCFGSCSKDSQTIVQNEWQVESIKVHADSVMKYLSEGNTYTLKFENRRNYSIKLDVNGCSGKVRFMSKNTVDFESTLCIKVCCDSDIARSIIDILAEVNKYDVSDATLTFTGDNGEILNLIK